MITTTPNRLSILDDHGRDRIMAIKRTEYGFRFREECDKYFELEVEADKAAGIALEMLEFVKPGCIKKIQHHDALVEALSDLTEDYAIMTRGEDANDALMAVCEKLLVAINNDQ